MKNGIIVEWRKVRHNNLLNIALTIIFIMTTIVVLKDILINVGVKDLGLESWVVSLGTILNYLLIPIVSGLFYTRMMNSEYTERTIINYIPAVVKRSIFVSSKIVVWMVCHLLMVFIVYLVACIGSLILFPIANPLLRLYDLGIYFLKSGLLGFLSLALLVPTSILQRSSYIPSIVTAIGIAIIGITATQLNGMLPFIFPWTAAFILSQPVAIPDALKITGYAVTIASSLMFYTLSMVIFNSQDI
ncbi:ABC transporter permease [Paenibacillus faecalis]|uniref:ABC transporter permease n=1 Tax=Paenibacillus faecalis TaxID=2079532 RepID=UPI000D0F46BA|nr:ABC transporter permease [Paenibacillus faecalis]